MTAEADEHDYIAEINEKIYVERFLQKLKPSQAELIRRRMSGMTQRDIAKYDGISQSYMSRKIKKIRQECLNGDLL